MKSLLRSLQQHDKINLVREIGPGELICICKDRRMGKTYFLDLPTLLEYLRGQSCMLTTVVTISGKSGNGYVFLKDGIAIKYLIRMQDGMQLEGQLAYPYLKVCTQWQVQLEQDVPASSQPSPSPQLDNSGPSQPPQKALVQKRMLDPSLLGHLDMRQRLILRTVLTMVNGQRSARQIKEQLNLPPHVVDEVLAYLYSIDIIE